MKHLPMQRIVLAGLLLFSLPAVSQVAPEAEPVYGGHLEQIDAIAVTPTVTRVFCSTLSPNSLFYQEVAGVTGSAPTFSGWTAVPDLDENDNYGYLKCFSVDENSGFVYACTMTGQFLASGIAPGTRYLIGNYFVEAIEAYNGKLFYEMHRGSEEWFYFCNLDLSGNITSKDSCLIASSPGWAPSSRMEIRVSPYDGHIYYFVPGSPPFIYKSSEAYNMLTGSTTWTLLPVANLMATGKEYYSLGIAPDGRLFTGSYEGNSSSYTAHMAYSDADGDPWSLVPITEDCGRGQVSITPGTPGSYYVYYSRVVSSDLGLTWSMHGGADGAICADPTGMEYAYVRTDWGSGCYDHTSGAVTEINNGLLAVQVNDFAMDQTKNTAWVASKSGIWHVTNYGTPSPTWSNPIWPRGHTVPWTSVVCSTTADTLFCGNNNGDVFRYEGASGPPTDPMSYEEIFRASDDAPYPYWNYTYGTYVSALAIDPYSADERIVVGLYDAEDWGEPDSLGAVFIGEYTGGTWNFDQIIGPPIPWTGLDVNDLVVVQENGHTTIYVGVEYNTTYGVVNGIYRMEETAPGSWAISNDLFISPGIPISATIKDLYLTKNDTILACGTDVSGTTVVSYKKAVGGTYWTVLPSSGLTPPNTGRAITYDETGMDTYMAVDNNLYVLSHGATAWSLYYSYPMGTNIQFIYYDDLLVGTGTGLYLHTVHVGQEEQPLTTDEVGWISVSPNPFHHTATFSIQEGFGTEVSVQIYNQMGKQVKEIRAKSRSGEQTTFEWDGTSESGRPLPDGIYLYKAKLNGFRATGKLVLMK